MKKILLYVLVLWIGCISCYEDDSAKDFKLIRPIVIDMGAMPSEFIVYQYGTLNIVPVIYKEGLDDKDLYFEWMIKGYGANRLLGTGMILNAVIHEEQQVDPYTLLLIVTDTLTGIKEIRNWNLQVSSRLSTGLMVADTRDGVTGDLSLIMAFNFANLTDERQDTVFRHIYSQGNGVGINGTVVGMANSNYNMERVTTVLSDRDIVRIDPASYIKQEEVTDLFYVMPEHKLQPLAIHFWDVAYPGEYLLESGQLYFRYMYSGAKKFGYPYQLSDGGEYAVSKLFLFPEGMSLSYTGVAFDSLNCRFLGIPDDVYYGQLTQLQGNGSAFNPGQVGDKRCVDIGLGKDGKIQAVLQDKSTGDYFIYSMAFERMSKKANIIGMADLGKCQRIQEAQYFSFSPLEEVMYYSVGNKIYAALLTSDHPQSHKCYETLAEKEQITSLMIWNGAGQIYYTAGEDGKDRVMRSDSRMLVITTYDGEKGKVISLPIENLGAGNIAADRKYHKEYKGFNRITAIASQVK